MPKYPAWYDWNDPENSDLVNAMAVLRHATSQSEGINSHTRKPGSREALQAINSAIDFWAKCETGNGEFFWRKPPSAG
jgi:hypothetical protein